LDDDFLGRLSALLAALFALPRPRVLGAVIMSRLPITPPEGGGNSAETTAVFSLAEITQPK
jgi:hypothetical protein